MKCSTFLIAMVLFTAPGFAQTPDEATPADVTDVLKITFLKQGISYEKKTGRFQTLYAQAFMHTTGILGFSGSLGNTSKFYYDPALTLQYRYYYNAAERQAKGKRTAMNSMNYTTAIFESALSKKRVSSSHFLEVHRRPVNKLAVAWGLQRNYSNRFSLDLNLGIGYIFAKATVPDLSGQPHREYRGEFTTIGRINLGFWLNSRQ